MLGSKQMFTQMQLVQEQQQPDSLTRGIVCVV